MYYKMFKRVFDLIERKYGYPVRWQHLHGEGFAAMIMDMDTKQLPGKLRTTYEEYITNLLLIY
jgi:hypothetical protein